MKPAIRVDNLSKSYRLGSRTANSYRTLRDTLAESTAGVWHGLRRRFGNGNGTANGTAKDDAFWALKDVSFEVQPGEVVGIIGRNGAGKSTLLKILSRIVEPTAGRCEVRGRMASLLEVGTGFHPELTGRENIYMNGSILGMGRKEIERKFDEIVAFSEIEQFLDTPVKRYSSGMYVRLAFAVAVHVEPQILVVDEVLAVGDLAFQQKCLKHMRSLTRKGMTILLVSHNMAAIQSCCQRAMFLERGQIEGEGGTVEVIEQYRAAQLDNKAPDTVAEKGVDGISIVGFEMFGEDGKPTREVQFGESIRIRIEIRADKRVERPMINFGITRGDGVIICNFNNWYDNVELDFLEGECTLEGWLPPIRLIPDYYQIHVLVWDWGGGHMHGDMEGSIPLASVTFGHFQVVGPTLNAHDGVFQIPARKWLYRRGELFVENLIAQDYRMEHV
jgi:lipopolysaccharide transport system ATP-binding protein